MLTLMIKHGRCKCCHEYEEAEHQRSVSKILIRPPLDLLFEVQQGFKSSLIGFIVTPSAS